MEISDLYAIAETNNHEVAEFRITASDSFSVRIDDRCYIAMAPGLSHAEEKSLLAHELGHCEYGGFYNIHSKYEVRSKKEAKADKWAIIHVIPLPDLKAAIASGCDSTFSLAEEFGVTEQFMKKALDFYAVRNLI